MEILAPAGDFLSIEAAIRGGADAVYFGLTQLNARRRARNFTPDEARRAVELLHAHGRRAYLTLNTDISYRELGLALAILDEASRLGFDAVLVRDPALLALRKAYPQLEFHWSTQTTIANSADVLAARELGADRVVLAREMTLDEIRQACAVPGIGKEVFAQGALCFSISGRCLMSSWVGGRSGNRGMCASPCRVPWQIDGQDGGYPLSMHDLCVLDHIQTLADAGVTALKIEGRLKSATWVEQAVELYRSALQGQEPALLRQRAEKLTAYTGRALSDGFLTGDRGALTGTNRGRLARQEEDSTTEAGVVDSAVNSDIGLQDGLLSDESEDRSGTSFSFSLHSTGPRLQCRLVWRENEVAWEYPKTVVRRAHKAISAYELCDLIRGRRFQGIAPSRVTADDPEFLLVPRTVNAVVEKISAEIGRLRRAERRPLEIRFPAGAIVTEDDLTPFNGNNRVLGDEPNRVRLSFSQLEDFVRRVDPVPVIVDDVLPEDVSTVADLCRKFPAVVALPPVFFEEQVPLVEDLVVRCKKARLPVEVNTWGGWLLARRAGVAFETGPGLGVLNPAAATFLRRLGARAVTISLESDRRQIEDLTAYAPVGLTLYVMGRPPLAISRVELPDRWLGRRFTDRGDLRMIARRQWGLWVFRPDKPFDWRLLRNERIRVKHLVVDLVASPEAVDEWLHVSPYRSRPLSFNYHRSLQ